MSVSAAVSDAWQAALRSEQQAVFGYGLLGAWLGDAAQIDRARRYAGEHGSTERQAVESMAGAGVQPNAPAADYPVLYPVGDAATAVRLAIRLEADCASAWRYLYARAASSAATPTTVRTQAQTALTAAAVRAAGWRGSAVPFPGI